MTGPCFECGAITDDVESRVIVWGRRQDVDLMCQECDFWLNSNRHGAVGDS